MAKRQLRAPFHDYNAWVFDLDNTLYPEECDLFAQIDVRMGEFLTNHFNVDLDEARRVQKKYYHQHGTTLTGLMRNDGIDPHGFLEHVHDIDVSVISPSPELSDFLGHLPGRKFVYTNGSDKHARNVMERLGVDHHFDGVFDIVAAGYEPKPARSAFDAFLERFKIEPMRAVMVEDLPQNLEPAHDLGMKTVLIRTDRVHERHGPTDESLDHIHHAEDDLLAWLRDIFEA
jgi:putative hydrolase of the HAD superfamily